MLWYHFLSEGYPSSTTLIYSTKKNNYIRYTCISPHKSTRKINYNFPKKVCPLCLTNGSINSHIQEWNSLLVVCPLGEPPAVQDGSGDVVEGEMRLCVGQPQRHESLSVVEELQLVGVGREDASPCLWTAATRQILKWTAIIKSFIYLFIYFHQ